MIPHLSARSERFIELRIILLVQRDFSARDWHISSLYHTMKNMTENEIKYVAIFKRHSPTLAAIVQLTGGDSAFTLTSQSPPPEAPLIRGLFVHHILWLAFFSRYFVSLL